MINCGFTRKRSRCNGASQLFGASRPTDSLARATLKSQLRATLCFLAFTHRIEKKPQPSGFLSRSTWSYSLILLPPIVWLPRITLLWQLKLSTVPVKYYIIFTGPNSFLSNSWSMEIYFSSWRYIHCSHSCMLFLLIHAHTTVVSLFYGLQEIPSYSGDLCHTNSITNALQFKRKVKKTQNIRLVSGRNFLKEEDPTVYDK